LKIFASPVLLKNIGLKMALGNKRLKNYIEDRDNICIPFKVFPDKKQHMFIEKSIERTSVHSREVHI
jgi:hypothetical protein